LLEHFSPKNPVGSYPAAASGGSMIKQMLSAVAVNGVLHNVNNAASLKFKGLGELVATISR
jgi:hypothetical protein